MENMAFSMQLNSEMQLGLNDNKENDTSNNNNNNMEVSMEENGNHNERFSNNTDVINNDKDNNTVISDTKIQAGYSGQNNDNMKSVSIVADKYMILDQMEGSTLHMCVNVHTNQDFVCKIVNKENVTSLLSAHYLLDSHAHINTLHEVMLGDKLVYLIFPPSHGDLHSYVRHRKRLKETEAKPLFRQIVETVSACHQHGIVLRDLKLRKFVFADSQRTVVRLETLEDAVLLEDSQSDELQDKRGCPAYVSPEILRSSHSKYSGKAADIWSLGIILYTMLVGRYPFSDLHHSSLFAKISRGHFTIPDYLSPKAKCLIRSILRREPNERLPAADILHHPWFTHRHRYYSSSTDSDQIVPNIGD